MTDLPPHLQRVEQDLMRAARTRLAPRRSRAGRAILGVGLAAVVTGSAAFAATGTNPIDFFRGDPAREVSVAPDTSARVTGDFPQAVICSGDQADASCRPVPGFRCTTHPDGSSECSGPVYRLAPGEWRMNLFSRVAAPRVLGKEAVLKALAARPAGQRLVPDGPPDVRDLTVGEFRAMVERRSPEFWRGLSRVASVQGGGVSSGDPQDPDHELVPPDGVSRFLTCRDDGGLRCTAVTGGVTLPVGSPLYTRDPDATWRSVPMTQGRPDGYAEQVRILFGRTPTAEEQIVLNLAEMVTYAPPSGSSARSVVTAGPDTVLSAP